LLRENESRKMGMCLNSYSEMFCACFVFFSVNNELNETMNSSLTNRTSMFKYKAPIGLSLHNSISVLLILVLVDVLEHKTQ